MQTELEPTFGADTSTVLFGSAEQHSQVSQFLAYEASLLDEDRLLEWFDLLDEDFIYCVPLRIDRERKQGGNGFAAGSYRMRDTKAALKFRIDRLLTGHAWAEELASRTCRLVGEVAVRPTTQPEIVEASSALFVYRQRGDQQDSEVIPARRRDRIRLSGSGAIRLLERNVLLTEKCLSTNNLALFL